MVKKNMIRGFKYSIWADGNIVETQATLDDITGEIFSMPSEIILDNPEEEYFESCSGDIKYKVCSICHDFIMRSEQKIDGDCISEFLICANGCNK